MEEIEVVLERHEQQIKTLERDMTDMKTVQAEIRSMHDTLVTLTTELKHANEHLARHERKIDEIDAFVILNFWFFENNAFLFCKSGV